MTNKEQPNENWETRFNEIYSQGGFYMRKHLENFIRNLLSQARTETLEEILNSLPDERNQDNLPYENSPEIYGNRRLEAYRKGFNELLNEIQSKLKELLTKEK